MPSAPPSSEPSTPPTAVISYSHEGEDAAWMGQVAEIAKLLRAEGIDVELDQFHTDTEAHWYTFGPECIAEREFVVCLASPSYKVAWDKPHEGGQGFGAAKEADAIRSRQRADGHTGIVWVVLPGKSADLIPAVEAGFNHVVIETITTKGLQPLIARFRRERASRPELGPWKSAPAMFGAFPERNPIFVGRADQLDALAAGLTGNGRSVVRDVVDGLGGVGKTDLAVEHAYRTIDSGSVDWAGFVVTETREQVAGGLATIGTNLGMIGLDDEPVEEFAVRVVGRLGGDDRWLLVLDNIEDPAHLDGLLPKVGSGQIVVTTRSHPVAEALQGTELVLGVPPLDEAVDLLRKRSKPLVVEQAELEEIAEGVGRLPLALDIAGAFLKKGYALDKVLAKLPSEPSQRRAIAIDRLWEATVERLSEPALRVLRLATCCAPDAIPIWALDTAELDSKLIDPDAAIDELLDWSLADVTRTAQGRTISIHRLLQDTVRKNMSERVSTTHSATPPKPCAQRYPMTSN